MAGKSTEANDNILSKMQVIITLLQDMLIIEGLRAGIKNDDLRRILEIDKKRVNRVSKYIRRPGSRNNRTKGGTGDTP